MAEKKLFGHDLIDALPAWTSIEYDAEIDRAKLKWNAIYNTYNDRISYQPG